MNSKLKLALRILLAVLCLISGLNKFFHFMLIPPIAGDGGTLMRIYASAGFLKIIGCLEILGGIALLLNKYVPMALIILIAIFFNAMLFHLLHDPAGVGGAVVGLSLSLVLFNLYKHRFLSILSP